MTSNLPSPTPAEHHFHRSILREYDIRGIYGETLSEADAWALGRSFASVLRRAGGNRIAVGRDGRLSSPPLEAALVEGLAAGGVDIVRLGLCTTPMLYFAEASLPHVQGGIQVTGSHNPQDHNGFKIVLRGAPFFGADITGLGNIAAAGEWIDAAHSGFIEEYDIAPAYVDKLLGSLEGAVLSRLDALRIGWDAGNGSAGPVLELLLTRLPGEHHLLFSDVDGRFPNHHPDPTMPENLADLRSLVVAKNLDFGVAFDGDADRLGAIDNRGRIIDADHLLAIFARLILARVPGALMVADVKASKVVFDLVHSLGGTIEMAPAGHSHIKSRMKETSARFGAETSGHFFFAEDWYGFDDAIFAALQLMAAIEGSGCSLAVLNDAVPAMINTPELRFTVPDDQKFAIIAEIRQRLESHGTCVIDIDGIRVDTPHGWWLLRASNTQAALTARAEAGSEADLKRLLQDIDEQLAAFNLSLPAFCRE